MGFVWVNTENGAVIQEEGSPFDYHGHFDTEDEAIDWLKSHLNNPGVDHESDWSHVELKQTAPAESHVNGEDIRKEVIGDDT